MSGSIQNINPDLLRAFEDGYDTCLREMQDKEQRKHGYWKLHSSIYACSVCGSTVSYLRSKYCPHCGARMDGDTDG